MRAVDEFLLQEYQDLGPFAKKENIRMKRHPRDGKICLEKRLDRGAKEIYETLKERSILGIPEIFLCVEDENELVVIEKYIEGKSLADLVAEGPMEWKSILPLVDSLCVILSGLHQGDAPVICRDLKAENIIIDRDGNPWLVDFDIARFYRQGKNRDTELLGTAEYAAPEQFGFFQTDQRTDIYSLGVLMNYMATGNFPVEKMAHGRMGDIVRKCTHLEPTMRYQNVAELQVDLIQLGKDLGLDVKKEVLPDRQSENNLLPPGFRRGKKSVMVLASFGYAFLLWFCFTLPITMEDVPLIGMHLRFQQSMIFLSQMVFIMYLFRYRNWGAKIPLLRSKNLLLRLLGLAAAWFVLICVAAMICVFGEWMFS